MKKQWVVSSFGSSGPPQSSNDLQNKNAAGKKRPREKYLKTSLNRNDDTSDGVKCDDILWINKYRPKTENELAVHKKKIEEVKAWLARATTSNCRSRILLLTGPSGAGKSATVKLLSSEMKYGIKEWINNSGLSYICGQNVYGESQLDTFREFLLYSSKYSSSQIFKEDITMNDHIVLLEEFPTFMAQDAKRDVSEFWNMLRVYNTNGIHPLVIIITDDSKDSFNLRKLLPKSLQEELELPTITFNQVAITSLNRCLKRVADAEHLNVSQELIESIASNSHGDIRTAINSLQFTSDTPQHTSAPIKAKSRQRSNKSAKIERVLSSTHSSALGSRDESLFLLHALGKILHCKRAVTYDERFSLPSTLKEMERRPLLTNPEDVWLRTSTSANNFLAFLHQNYLSFVTDSLNLEWSGAYLSFADAFNSEWAGGETLNDYIFSVASRGIMFGSTDHKIGWKPLNRPQLSDVENTRVQNIQHGKEMFKGSIIGVSMTEMFSEIIPFISKIRPRNYSAEQIRFASNIGTVSQRNEDDVSEANYKLDIGKHTKSSPTSRPSLQQPSQEEFDIEEFDD